MWHLKIWHVCIVAVDCRVSVVYDVSPIKHLYIHTSHIPYTIDTGYFRKVYQESIYPNIAAKAVSSVYLSIEYTNKNIHIMF